MTEATSVFVKCESCGTALYPVRKEYGVCPVASGVEPGFCDSGKLVSWTKKNYDAARSSWWMAQFPAAVNINATDYEIVGQDGVWRKSGKPLRKMQRVPAAGVFAAVGFEGKVYCFTKSAAPAPCSVMEGKKNDRSL